MDNIFVRILTKIFDLLLLNLLFVICSLPVVTIGAALSALYTVLMKMAENKEGYIIKGFFNALKKNFRQSTFIWIILLIIGMMLEADFVVLSKMEGNIRNVMWILWIAVMIFYVIEVVFVFPLMAKFENTTSQMLKNAMLIPISRLPIAFAIMLLIGICGFVTLLNQKTVMYGAVIWNTIGISILGYAVSVLLNIMFAPYENT